MDNVRSTIFLPFRSSMSVSENQIKELSIYNAQEHLEPRFSQKHLESRFSQKQMLSMNLANAVPGAGMKAADFNSFAISIASGESLWLLFTHHRLLDGFKCKAIRHRDAKLFLVDDPEDERVKKAARTVCHEQPGVFALTNEVRSLATRVRSLQSLPSECNDIFCQVIPGVDRDELILFLALKGFYFQDGSVRCNGCQYRKGLHEFAALAAEQIYKVGTKSVSSALRSLLGKDIFAGHDNADCFNAKETRKTLFSISDGPCGRPLEHGHYSLYHDDWKNHYCDGYNYSVPMPKSKVKTRKCIDQYLRADSMNCLFTTTVPKSQFLTQDDLFYEASTIKSQLDNLRDRYGELKRLVDRFDAGNPALAKAFHLPRVDSLLSPQIGKVYSKIVVKMAEKEAKALPRHDKAGLQRLLDHLLAMIEHSGGAVASRGLQCLTVQPDHQGEQDFLQYGTPQNTPVPSGDSDELTKIRHKLYNLRNDYAKAIVSEVLAPLLEIFNPFELNHDVLKKVFGVSDAYIASLTPMPLVSLYGGAVPGRTVTDTSHQIDSDSLSVLRRRKGPDACQLPPVLPIMGKTKASDKDIKKNQ